MSWCSADSFRSDSQRTCEETIADTRRELTRWALRRKITVVASIKQFCVFTLPPYPSVVMSCYSWGMLAQLAKSPAMNPLPTGWKVRCLFLSPCKWASSKCVFEQIQEWQQKARWMHSVYEWKPFPWNKHGIYLPSENPWTFPEVLFFWIATPCHLWKGIEMLSSGYVMTTELSISKFVPRHGSARVTWIVLVPTFRWREESWKRYRGDTLMQFI